MCSTYLQLMSQFNRVKIICLHMNVDVVSIGVASLVYKSFLSIHT